MSATSAAFFREYALDFNDQYIDVHNIISAVQQGQDEYGVCACVCVCMYCVSVLCVHACESIRWLRLLYIDLEIHTCCCCC